MRILGWLAMALGVVGIIAGLLFAAGLWVVKPNIQTRVDGLVMAADTGLVRAITLTDAVNGGLVAVNDKVGEIKAKADNLVANPIFDGSVAASLATNIGDFVSGPYASLKSSYVALKERVTNAAETLQALDNAIPMVTLPGDATERLQALDAKVTAIDATVNDLVAAGAEGLQGPGIPARISQRAADAQTTLTNVSQVATDLSAKMQGTRDRLATANANFDTALTLTAAGATLFGLYFAGLNILLFQQGRRWSSRKAETPPAS